MIPADFAFAMLEAFGLDALIGWPGWLFQWIGHPVAWIGRLISFGDVWLNRGAFRRLTGACWAGLVILVCILVGWLVARMLPGDWIAVVLTGVLAWPFVAVRSLHEHVADVSRPLAAGDLDGARKAVSRIVGRNPETLDSPAVARAAIETLAENASDGVVAPLFWGAIFGLPGIIGYKAVNTLDSMIGYRNEKYADFGWAAARIDDAANWIPARLTGMLIAGAAKARGTAFRTMRRDAHHHRSPNAGWPEAAMAGALAVRLSGPRVYDGTPTSDPWLNGVAGDPRAEDVGRALGLYRRAMVVFGVVLMLAGVL